MTQAVFSVAMAGPHVSVQDAGRTGLLRFGVPASGPMDRTGFAVANAALGNPAGAPGIEVSTGGLVLDCTAGAVSFAVAGGGFQVHLGGTRLGAWIVAAIAAGERLTIRPGPWGSWTYLAFAGQVRAETWLGSAATHGPSGLGGGRLRSGGTLVVEAGESRPDRHGSIPCPVSARPRSEVRVVLGPQDRFFGTGTIATLLSRPFLLTDAYDRMGVRLSGPPLRPEGSLDMPSEAVVRGSVQVAGDGVATVLLADHQTTGGYPRIATILSGDVDRFVQLRSRGGVAFRAVTPEAAVAAVRSHSRSRALYMAAVSRPGPRMVMPFA